MKKNVKVIGLCLIMLLVLIGAKPLFALAEPSGAALPEPSQEEVLQESEPSEEVPIDNTTEEPEAPMPSPEEEVEDIEDTLDAEEIDEEPDMLLLAYDEIYDGPIEITAATSINNKNVLYRGAVYMNANLTISGTSNVVITGSLYIESGTLSVQNTSKLDVEGSMRIQTRSGTQSSGGLQIINTAVVDVSGDFIANTTFYRSTSASYSLFPSATAAGKLILRSNSELIRERSKTDTGTTPELYLQVREHSMLRWLKMAIWEESKLKTPTLLC